MLDDAELLRQYAECGSNEAFTAFVQGRLDLVYTAAVRRTGGDAHLAKDISQQVFCAAARQAATIARHPHPTAWLYETTRFTASSLMRADRRRKLRERMQGEEAQMIAESDPEWERLAPLLDEAIDRLDQGDRSAVLLRFFDGLAFPEIAARLELSDAGARLRVDRALEKLRRVLARKGITSTAAGLSVVLESQAVSAAPAGLASALSGGALSTAGAPLTDAGGAAVSKTLFIMSTTKVFIAAVAILAIGSTLYQVGKTHRAEDALTAITQDRDAVAKRLEAEANQVKQLQARLAAPSRGAPGFAAAPGGRGPAGGLQGIRIGPGQLQALMQNPQYRKLQARSLEGQLDGRYAALFKNLALTPDQLTKFKNALVEKQLATSDAVSVAAEQGIRPMTDPDGFQQAVKDAQGPVDQQIKGALGDAGYNQYQQYEQTLPERAIVNQLQQSLSYTPTPLTDDQANQMIQVLHQSAPSSAASGVPLRIPMPLPNGPISMGNGNASVPISDQTVSQAQAVLSPGQLQAFQQIRSQQQVQQQLQQQMMQFLQTTVQGGGNGGPPP